MIHPGTFLKGLGIGAGLMYFFDPDRGNQRRALLRDQMVCSCKTAQNAVDMTIRDLQNRTQGMACEVQSMLSGEQPDDRTLSERIRSQMGRYVSHPRAVNVDVNQGRVMLAGPILASEAQNFVRAVKHMRGVQGVENQLEVHQAAEGVSALQGGRPRYGARSELLQSNWSPSTRALASTVGLGLMANCLFSRSPMSLLLGTVGFGLFARGTSNEPIRRLTGLETAAERGTNPGPQQSGRQAAAHHETDDNDQTPAAEDEQTPTAEHEPLHGEQPATPRP